MSEELRLPGVEILSAQVPGTKRARGERGDDRIRIGSSGSIGLVVLADGAGSAERGGYGAELAAESAFESMSEQLDRNPPPPLAEVLEQAMTDARETLSMAAKTAPEDDPFTLEDLATTLTLAIFGSEQIAVAAIGDGIQIVRDDDGALALVATAPDTEIANQTSFLTGPDFPAPLELDVRPAAEVESLLLSSDGLDTQLIDRDGKGRWPLQPTVTGLLNAPTLQDWGPAELTALLDSELIRRHSDDDLSLVLVRRIVPPGPNASEVDGLSLTPTAELRPGCPTWLVAGCASLLAVAPGLDLSANRGIARREGQVWDRGRRYGPVNWPVGRLAGDLVLVQRPPLGAALVGGKLARAEEVEEAELLTGVRAAVDALHTAGLSHGSLALDSFALYPDRTVVLWEPGAGMFEGVEREKLRALDRYFVAGLGPSAAAPPGLGDET